MYDVASEARRASSRARLVDIGPSWCITVKSLSETCADWAEIFLELTSWRDRTEKRCRKCLDNLMVHCLDRQTHIILEKVLYIRNNNEQNFCPSWGVEMKVWHFLEQDCDIVMCHILRLYYTKYLTLFYTKCGRFSRLLGNLASTRGWHTLIYNAML